jgi:hypothetical protein
MAVHFEPTVSKVIEKVDFKDFNEWLNCNRFKQITDQRIKKDNVMELSE